MPLHRPGATTPKDGVKPPHNPEKTGQQDLEGMTGRNKGTEAQCNQLGNDRASTKRNNSLVAPRSEHTCLFVHETQMPEGFLNICVVSTCSTQRRVVKINSFRIVRRFAAALRSGPPRTPATPLPNSRWEGTNSLWGGPPTCLVLYNNSPN